jgi:hypothetical protein
MNGLDGMRGLDGTGGLGGAAYVVTAEERNLPADLSETAPLNTGIVRELPTEPGRTEGNRQGGFFGRLFRSKKEPPPEITPAAEESEWLEVMDVRSDPH